MTTGRYRIRKIEQDVVTDCPHADGKPVEPYGLWDTVTHTFVNKYGEPDPTYWACCRAVAEMRRSDLNYYKGQ